MIKNTALFQSGGGFPSVSICGRKKMLNGTSDRAEARGLAIRCRAMIDWDGRAVPGTFLRPQKRETHTEMTSPRQAGWREPGTAWGRGRGWSCCRAAGLADSIHGVAPVRNGGRGWV